VVDIMLILMTVGAIRLLRGRFRPGSIRIEVVGLMEVVVVVVVVVVMVVVMVVAVVVVVSSVVVASLLFVTI
jgi:hypothetical protein